MTIDSAKYRALGDVGSLQPSAQRPDQAGLLVLSPILRKVFAVASFMALLLGSTS